MATDASFVWVRPATEVEGLIDFMNKTGTLVTVYGLSLRCSVTLTDAHVKAALHHLFRKVPSLRTCFRQRGDTLWVCEMTREHLDFQVTATQEVLEAAEKLCEHRFPTTEGPLWCARLLPAGTGARCCRPELAAAFPFTRTLLLANHHGIADGTTNMLITDVFLRLLDHVVTGTPVDDAQQVGKLVGGEHTQAMLKARREELMQDQDHLQHLLKNMEKSVQEKLIPRAYPMARNPEFKSQMVVRDLDKDSTHAFIRKCKKEGITVNSGIVAAINVGLVDFVREGGLEQDFYRVHETHAINARRYWPGDTSGTLGIHGLVMKTQHIVLTPAKWRDNFWEYARNIHKNITENLQDKCVTTYEVMLFIRSSGQDFLTERPSPQCDYGAANMGDLDHLVPTEGQQVRLAHLFRAVSCSGEPVHFSFHTLRGCFIYTLTYAKDVLTRDKANKFVDKIFDNMAAVTHM